MGEPGVPLREEASSDVIRLARPDVGVDELEAIAEVFATGQLTMGPKVTEFEGEIARACGTKHAHAVSSGTAALHLAVLAMGIGEGDEVLVPAYTFPATANVVALAGARPVLVDVDPLTMNMDPELAAEAVTDHTRAVLGVHLFGRPLRVEELPDGLPLLEDAAGALGARRGDRPCGSLGELACFSFHPRKIVTTGEGGAVTTDDDELADAILQLRHHGWTPPGYKDMPVAGLNYRLSDILCAVGIPQMRRLEQLLRARERVAAGYEERLGSVVEVPFADEGDRHGWQAYVIRLDRRDEALHALRAEGIQCQIGTYALHRLTAYAGEQKFPGADASFRRALALPFHTRLTDSELDRVAEVVKRFA